MSTILLTAPAIEPVALDEMRAFLRVETADDDAVIAALIVAARLHVEAATHRALIAQTWRLVRDRWPAGGRIPVRPGPLRALVAARVYDADGTAQPLDLQAFIVDTATPLLAAVPWALPAPGRAVAGIELDVEVGYGTADTDVPEALRQAIRLLVAHWYENRGLIAPGATPISSLPATVAALLTPYRTVSL